LLLLCYNQAKKALTSFFSNTAQEEIFMKRVAYEEMVAQFARVLEKHGFTPSDAKDAAVIFAQNSLSGVYSHGLNRFPRVVSYLEAGEIDPLARAECISRMGSMERWDGHRGFGPLNAQRAMERACALAKENGVGIVALGNNNHWMRGGTYGWLAAEKGCIGICWSNTAPNMPAWGAKDCRIGNNPFILAVPRSDGQHVMVDCALSQFSYGKLESTRLAGRQLPVPGGCDEDGQLTTDPAAIEKSGRALPIGYWKGSGLSILLDLIATLLSGGNAVHTIGTFGDEIGLTQIMIAIDPTKFGTVEENDAVINAILADIKASTPARPDGEVRWPGEGMLRTIKENRELGVPVVEEIWESVLKM
jgi:3-dehydro-L-gulonate 2-dehydrogenase